MYLLPSKAYLEECHILNHTVARAATASSFLPMWPTNAISTTGKQFRPPSHADDREFYVAELLPIQMRGPRHIVSSSSSPLF